MWGEKAALDEGKWVGSSWSSWLLGMLPETSCGKKFWGHILSPSYGKKDWLSTSTRDQRGESPHFWLPWTRWSLWFLPTSMSHDFLFYFIILFFCLCSFFFFYFILLCNTVLVLPYIDMNPPWVYMWPQTWTPLPPPSLQHPSGSSPCTSPKHAVSCIGHRLVIRFLHDSIH